MNRRCSICCGRTDWTGRRASASNRRVENCLLRSRQDWPYWIAFGRKSRPRPMSRCLFSMRFSRGCRRRRSRQTKKGFLPPTFTRTFGNSRWRAISLAPPDRRDPSRDETRRLVVGVSDGQLGLSVAVVVGFERAGAVDADMGLSVSDAIRLLLYFSCKSRRRGARLRLRRVSSGDPTRRPFRAAHREAKPQPKAESRC
jgi:hypothetical protein